MSTTRPPQLFLEYADALTRLPRFRDRLLQTNGALTADESADLDQLARSVPKLVSLLPDALPDRSSVHHNAALTEMTNELVYHLDRAKPLAIVRPRCFDLRCIDLLYAVF